ncbi:hypothetical protein AUQ37_07390 [Candidatus Methanomethylophilus sp. 1R26]|uniref:hypothetical protein n=1 Tax=Candidatus Methanomethylophilus sp. 1R26 TaxID=1769296 RepID=UPI000736FBA9|nr:hypothetical protein [Candidatus Methanomethylophilus sp. 1R26]KUE73855.1 hypothetical protein AUQ37_07390 [Candidatus Methanomethylophilus sp. 1R26]
MITIVSVLTLISALIAIAMGALFIAGADSFIDTVMDQADLSRSDAENAMEIAGIIIVIFGLILLGIAAGLYKGITVFWYIGVVIYLIGLIGSLLTVWSGVGIVELVICIVVLYYLFRPNVKEFFKV